MGRDGQSPRRVQQQFPAILSPWSHVWYPLLLVTMWSIANQKGSPETLVSRMLLGLNHLLPIWFGCPGPSKIMLALVLLEVGANCVPKAHTINHIVKLFGGQSLPTNKNTSIRQESSYQSGARDQLPD